MGGGADSTSRGDVGSFLRSMPIGDPLVRTHPETLEKERGVSVKLTFWVNESGLLTVAYSDFLSEKEDDRIKDQARPFLLRYLSRIIMVFILPP